MRGLNRHREFGTQVTTVSPRPVTLTVGTGQWYSERTTGTWPLGPFSKQIIPTTRTFSQTFSNVSTTFTSNYTSVNSAGTPGSTYSSTYTRGVTTGVVGYPRKFGSAALTLAETLTDSNQDSTIGDADEYWTQSTATVSSINNNFAFGTNDFTIEFWYNPGYPKATEEFGTQIGQGTVLEVRDDAISGGLENGLVWYYQLDGGPDTATFKFVDTVSNAMIQVSGTSSLINDTSQFFHHAITRSTNRIRIFIDGKMIANTAIAANVSIGPTSWPGNRVRLRIGGNSDSTWIPGNIDAIRISNSARFTANYNPASQGPVYNDSTALYVANFDGVLTDEYDKTWAIAPGYAEDAYLDNEL